MSENDFQAFKTLVLNKLMDLDGHLTYHGIPHTHDVLAQCLRIAEAEGITDEQELLYLRFAAIYHDVGFLETYAEHERKGCEIFLRDVKDKNFAEEDIKRITELIMVTKLPQQPHTLIEKVICDADLDYLGREDFYSMADNLRKEFLHFNIARDEEHWNELQLHFLSTHNYHTDSSKLLREPVKHHYLTELVQAERNVTSGNDH